MDYRNGTDRLSAILDGNGIPIRKPEGPDTGFAIEPFALFAAKITSGTDNYLQQRHDEALRDDPEMARRMRNDVFLMSLMQERKLAVASLKWHLEVDDEKDPKQKAMKDGLTRVLRATPRLQKLFMYLLEATWYGRYGSNVAWEWEPMLLPTEQDGQPEKRKSLRIAAHLPINGDKIVYGHDGNPSVTVYAPIASEIGDRAEFGMSNIGGRTLKLVKPWRERFIIHQHEIIDADFFDAEQADMMHGIGIRSVVYWMNWLRTEWLSNITDWCQRTGLGVRLWYYQGGNAASKAGVKAAAERQTDKTNLLIPRFGDNPHEGVEYVDTSGAGADLLLKLIQHMEERIERYIIGQSMSGGQDEGNGLGGTGRAMLAADTKTRIVRFDANNLAETLTEDVVKVQQRWTYPEMRDVPCRFLFDVDDPDPQAMLSAAQTFIGLGGTVKEDDVRSALGFGKPQEGDAMLGGQQPGGMPGMPGQPQMGPDGQPIAQDGEQPQPGEGGQPAEPPQDEQVEETDFSPEDEDIFRELYGDSDDGEIKRYNRQPARAPKGYTRLKPLMIAGKAYIGGQVIPKEELDKASPQQKAALGVQQDAEGGQQAKQPAEGQQHGQASQQAANTPKQTPQGQQGQQQPQGQSQKGKLRADPGSLSAIAGMFNDHLGKDKAHLRKRVDEKFVRDLIGVGDDIHLDIKTTAGGLGVQVSGSSDKVDWICRTLNRVGDAGGVEVHNDYFKVHEGQQGSGYGTEVFTNQVRSAIENGISAISCLAAKNTGRINTKAGEEAYNGYSTWPKLGYNADIPQSRYRALPKELKQHKPKTLLQLYALPGGADWWKAYGTGMHMEFDLSPGSDSIKALNRYLEKKGKPPIVHPGEQHGEPLDHAQPGDVQRKGQEQQAEAEPEASPAEQPQRMAREETQPPPIRTVKRRVILRDEFGGYAGHEDTEFTE